MKLAADSSTVGEKLQCISALHSQEITVRTNTLAGSVASEGRESKPWKGGRVCPTVNAGIYNGQQVSPDACCRHSEFAFHNVM